jgi:hypothetical protein
MGRCLALGALLLTSCVVSGAADARRGRCASDDEMIAVQTAAVQQELMVAALTCNEVTRFNAFQTGFGPELRASDARLASLFRRLYGGRRGEAAYHAFKTKLANDSEMRSIHNNPAYCQEAGAMLTTAVAPERPRLAAFVRNLSIIIEQRPAEACLVQAAAGDGPRAVRRHRHRRLASQ